MTNANNTQVERSEELKTAAADLCPPCGQEAAAVQSTPTSNTGGLVSEAYSTYVVAGGKLKEVPLKRGVSTAAFVDTLTFTVHEDVFVRPDQLGTEEEITANVSAELEEIMGYGLFCHQTGRNGYETSYKMGNETVNYGFVALGGNRQRQTICFYFTGEGLVAAKEGWEVRLYNYFKTYAPFAKITRCDLAHDFLDGEYTPEQAKKDWENGLYTARQSCPVAECVGSDWLKDEGRGKTFYIGSRKNSSRFARIYEKGKQLGDKDSRWVRVELEMKNRDILIPHEVLIEPGRFLTGAYPVFEVLFEQYQETAFKAEKVKKVQDLGHEHVLKYASMQVSPAIKMLMEMGFSDSQIVETLLNPKAKLPKRLVPEAFDCSYLNVAFIHEHKRLPYSEAELLEKFSNELNPPKRMTHRTYDQYLEAKTRYEGESIIGLNRNRSYEEYMYDRYLRNGILNLNERKTT
ncbi:replication initiation factor domain-containing protein [Neisseria perflava]|uniref:replication initiation factor domain-containing protein n=1 Tax=Neisseria perflava TaxID=33053 RepID=UPI00209FC639|nr:replication initiation factor domain-containing protein [Neisseria perflava]MCP1661305.1 phage replication initiation protein [Neisseria perflava]MCP1773400.1 phage replication initiation protein [Neisseria perflava]